MFSSSEGYPFRLKSKRDEIDGTLKFRRHTYTFKSPKTNQTYIIEVDEFEDFLLFAIKFYLKSHRDSPKRFTLTTGLKEAPSIITTCVNVMIDLYIQNPFCSFTFVGMPLESEQENKDNTKRFRLYSKIMKFLFSDKKFHHYHYSKSSVYLLLNRDFATNQPNLLEQIETFFLKHYELNL
jgi:hypothetical protein